MIYKNEPATPEEIAKLRLALFETETSAKLMFERGVTDDLHYLTSFGYFHIKRVDFTGVFHQDFNITKRMPKYNLYGKGVRYLMLDDFGDFLPEPELKADDWESKPQ